MISAYKAFSKTGLASAVLLVSATSLSTPQYDTDIAFDGDWNDLTEEASGPVEIPINPINREIYDSESVRLNTNGDGDQRDAVLNTHTHYNGIGVINDNCTGTLIGPNHVITAAHCFDQWDGITPIQFTAIHTALNGDTDIFRSWVQPNYVAIHPLYQSSDDDSISYQNIQYDVAIIMLDEGAPSAFNQFQIASLPLDQADGRTVHVMGYSADIEGLSAHWNANIVLDDDYNIYLSNGDMARGASGGPLIDAETGQIIGINSAIGHASLQTPIFRGMFSDPTVEWLYDSGQMEIRMVEVISQLNVRAAPYVEAPIIHELQNGDCVIIDRNREGEWLQVRFNPLAAPSGLQNVSSHFLSEPHYMTAYEARERCPNLP